MAKQLEKSYEILFQYMITLVRLLHAQKWKDSTLLNIEKWLVKLKILLKWINLLLFFKTNDIIYIYWWLKASYRLSA